MKTRMLGILAVSALLGTALATTGIAQDRGRGGFDGPRGEVRGGPGQNRSGMRGGLRGRAAAAQPERFIDRHDTDADGKVSAAEFVDESLQHVDELFERGDTNGDGLISTEEHAAPRGLPGRPGRGPRGERAGRPEFDQDTITACVRETIADYEPLVDLDPEDNFDDADTGGDGNLSLAEVNAAIEARAYDLFDRLDADGDGYVTEDEATAIADAQLEIRRAVQDCVREQR